MSMLTCENRKCLKKVLSAQSRITVTRKRTQSATVCTHVAIVCSWSCLNDVVKEFIEEETEGKR